MALPNSGKISINDILTEMKWSGNTNISLNNLATKWYEVTKDVVFNKQEHKLSDWRGKSWPVPKEFLLSEKNFKSNEYKDILKTLCSSKPIVNYVKRWHLGSGLYPKVGESKIYTNKNLTTYLLHGDRVPWSEYYTTPKGPIFRVDTLGNLVQVYNCPLVINQLSISPSFIENISILGGVYTIAVKSNGPWTARITRGETDSSISNTSGNGNGSFTLRVFKLGKDINRLQALSGSVTVTSGNKSVTLTWLRNDLRFEEKQKGREIL